MADLGVFVEQLAGVFVEFLDVVGKVDHFPHGNQHGGKGNRDEDCKQQGDNEPHLVLPGVGQ